MTSITDLSLDKYEPAEPSDLGRVQVLFTTDDSPTKCIDQAKPLVRDVLGPTKYVAEFYAGLASPRSVATSDVAFTPCIQSTNLGETTCIPSAAPPVTRSGPRTDKPSEPPIIKIVRRPDDTPVILEVSVQGGQHEQFIAHKVTIPANKIVESAVTADGEILLRDDTDLTWKFVITRPELERRLWKRGCSSREHSPEERKSYLANLEDFGIDLACRQKVK